MICSAGAVLYYPCHVFCDGLKFFFFVRSRCDTVGEGIAPIDPSCITLVVIFITIDSLSIEKEIN